MATRYRKGNSATLSTRIIHRYLPREVGELLVWYLWLVLPFQRRVEQLLWRGDTETGTGGTERGYIDNHLWPRDPGPEGREWKAARLVITEPPVDTRMEAHFVAAAECAMDTLIPGIAVADDMAM